MRERQPESLVNGCGCEARRVEGVALSMRGPEALGTRGRDARDTTSRAIDRPSTVVVRRASARERTIAVVIASAVIGLFGGLWLLQRTGFDFGVLFGPCGMKQRTGLPCPTCGMTTAVLAFARGEVLTAFYVQPAGALLCTLLVGAAFFASLTALLGVYFTFFDRVFAELKVKWVVAGLLVILAAGWAVTLARAAAA
jgi:hypothetical protein